MDKLYVLKPRISEKSYGTSQVLNTYVFEVPAEANKLTVAAAVGSQFGVTVTNVRMLNHKGKAKRTFTSRRGSFNRGTRADVKKAYVTLEKGDTIPVFATEEAESTPAQKKEKK